MKKKGCFHILPCSHAAEAAIFSFRFLSEFASLVNFLAIPLTRRIDIAVPFLADNKEYVYDPENPGEYKTKYEGVVTWAASAKDTVLDLFGEVAMLDSELKLCFQVIIFYLFVQKNAILSLRYKKRAPMDLVLKMTSKPCKTNKTSATFQEICIQLLQSDENGNKKTKTGIKWPIVRDTTCRHFARRLFPKTK